jgi:uncharacterized protein YceK
MTSKHLKGLILLLSVLSLSGCATVTTSTSSNAVSSDNDFHRELKKDFYDRWVTTKRMDLYLADASNASLSDVGIKQFYGEFRGAFVLSYTLYGIGGHGTWATCLSITLGKTTLVFDLSWQPHVWMGGQIEALSNAYSDGVIMDADLPAIQAAADGNYPNL